MKLTGTRLVLLAVVLAVIVGGALVAISVAGSDDDTTATFGVHGGAATTAMLRGIPQRGNVLGDPKAPVTLHEYADFQCPFCARFAVETLPVLVREYVRTGKAKLAFHGVAILGPDSLPPLQAAYAAAEQNRLWQYTELVYHNQGQENSGWVNDELLRSLGESVPGLDVGKMMDARSSASVQTALGDAQETWVAAGLQYTPTLVATNRGGGRKVLEGALPTQQFRDAIDELLQA
jgi:protein-disulfide isomerase